MEVEEGRKIREGLKGKGCKKIREGKRKKGKEEKRKKDNRKRNEWEEEC